MRVKASKPVWEELEEGLGSVGKIRLVREMVLRPEEHFTRYMLEKQARMAGKIFHVFDWFLAGFGFILYF